MKRNEYTGFHWTSETIVAGNEVIAYDDKGKEIVRLLISDRQRDQEEVNKEIKELNENDGFDSTAIKCLVLEATTMARFLQVIFEKEKIFAGVQLAIGMDNTAPTYKKLEE